jgi:hypothetical protein
VAPFKRALQLVDELFAKHVASEAHNIYGDAGMGLKAKALEGKLKEVEAGTLKMYSALKAADDKYAPKIKVSFPASGAKVINTKGGKPMEPVDIQRGDQVTAVVRIKGMFFNSMLVSTQLEAALVAVRTGSAVDASAIFADIIEQDDEAGPAPGAKRKADALGDGEDEEW